MNGDLRYVYGIAGATAADRIAAARLRGVDGAAVETVVHDPLVAAASTVTADTYGEAPLNEHIQDIDWLAPRAAQHQDVNAKLLQLTGGAVVPLSFGAIYRSDEGIHGLLDSRGGEFARRLAMLSGRGEWIISIERHDAAAAPSEALRRLEDDIAAAPPGRAFLLSKRRDETVREERRARDAAVVHATAAWLEGMGGRVYAEPLIEGSELPLVARFSVLAPLADAARLASEVERFGTREDARGYRVRSSGPWPAYRFGSLESVTT
jgi:hypothetical protein